MDVIDFVLDIQAYFVVDIDTWFTKVKSLSDYSSKLTNSLGWTGRYVCLLSFEQLSRAARRGSPFRTTSLISGPFVWHLFVQLIPNLLPTERYSVFYENCVSLYLSHLFISSEARKSAPKKLAIGPRPWSVVGGNFIYGSLWIAGQRYDGLWECSAFSISKWKIRCLITAWRSHSFLFFNGPPRSRFLC